MFISEWCLAGSPPVQRDTWTDGGLANVPDPGGGDQLDLAGFESTLEAIFGAQPGGAMQYGEFVETDYPT